MLKITTSKETSYIAVVIGSKRNECVNLNDLNNIGHDTVTDAECIDPIVEPSMNSGITL
jgi:hypothetical protein